MRALLRRITYLNGIGLKTLSSNPELNMVVVLSEDAFVDRNSLNGRELHTIAESARLFGCRVYPIPSNFDDCGNASNALAYVPTFSPTVPGFWVGYIPDL